MKSFIVSCLPQKTQESKTTQLYHSLLENVDINNSPHQFVRCVMSNFDGLEPKPDRSVHGRIFEYAIGEALARKGILPLYYQAELLHVPLATFDWFLYDPIRPVSISCKTKARDRWKQAAYEGMALKRVYAQAVNYLVTIEELSKTGSKKVEAPQTIDHFVLATEPEFDDVVEKIARHKFSEAKKISPILKGNMIDIKI